MLWVLLWGFGVSGFAVGAALGFGLSGFVMGGALGFGLSGFAVGAGFGAVGLRLLALEFGFWNSGVGFSGVGFFAFSFPCPVCGLIYPAFNYPEDKEKPR